MATPKQPAVAVTLTIPRDAGTQTVRASTRPLPDVEFVEGRVPAGGWTAIKRELSDEQGQASMATGGVTLTDDDGVLRAALAEDVARFCAQTEALVTVRSEEGRRANLTPRPLLRARVDVPTNARGGKSSRSRQVSLALIDALAPYYDQTIPRELFLREDFPDIDRAIENTPIPLIGGPHSDAGALDVNGNSAEQGLCPAIFVGMRKTVDFELTDTPAFLTPPTIVSAAPDAATGTTELAYGMTKLTAYGETVLSEPARVLNAPAALTPTDSVTLTWDADPDATGFVVYGRTNYTPVRRLKVLGAGVTSYTDTGVDAETSPGPPAINTAQVILDPDPSNPDSGFFWYFFVVCLGVLKDFDIYGSDLAVGRPPKRTILTEDYGITILHPFQSSGPVIWPHPDPWVEIGGKRVTGFYARGPIADHHVRGVVTFAVSTCGYEAVGDGTGLPVRQIFPLLALFLNEFVLKNGGLGYSNGDWGPLETFTGGTEILRTSRFTAMQDLTKLFLDNDEGYIGSVYLREPTTVRQFLQWFFNTVDGFGSTSHQGQWYPDLYNPYASVDDGRPYRERIEIDRLGEAELDRDNVEPRVLFQYAWNPDQKKFRSEVEKAQDDEAYDKQKAQLRDRGTVECHFSHDAATVRDAQRRRVQRLRYPRWKQPIVAKWTPALEDEPGDQILVTHRDGVGANGWENRPFKCISQEIDPNVGEVLLVAYDIEPLLTGAFAPSGLGDETTMSGNLGDEESSAPPPVGAFRV